MAQQTGTVIERVVGLPGEAELFGELLAYLGGGRQGGGVAHKVGLAVIFEELLLEQGVAARTDARADVSPRLTIEEEAVLVAQNAGVATVDILSAAVEEEDLIVGIVLSNTLAHAQGGVLLDEVA